MKNFLKNLWAGIKGNKVLSVGTLIVAGLAGASLGPVAAGVAVVVGLALAYVARPLDAEAPAAIEAPKDEPVAEQASEQDKVGVV